MYLSGNQISEVSTLTAFTNLTQLDLQNNPLDCPAYLVSIPVIEESKPGVVGVIETGPTECFGPPFLRGDATASDGVNMTDAILTLTYLFLGEVEIPCLDAADSKDDGTVDLMDAILTLKYRFLGCVEIPAPGPDECGVDRTSDLPYDPQGDIGCESYPDEACGFAG